MAQTEIVSVNHTTANQRLDILLAKLYPQKTRSFFNRLIKQKYILVNGQCVKSGYCVHEGDQVSVEFPEQKLDLVPVDIPLQVVYEDDDIVVINKPAGMVVHPGRGTGNHTLVHALLYHTEIVAPSSATERPGIVHRLDKNTSGLIVVAKNDFSLVQLRQQFAEKTIQRVYWTLVWGKFENNEGTIKSLLKRNRRDPMKMAVASRGKEAITHYRIRTDFEYVTLLEVQLETGRTHQIRVHMKYIQHPVVGDPEYNGRDSQLKRLPQNLRKRGKQLLDSLPYQALHAKKLTFLHPKTHQLLEFESPLPDLFTAALGKIPALFLLQR